MAFTTTALMVFASTSFGAKKPTGAPIKIMADTGVGTPLGSFPGDWAGAKAAARTINAAGGVKGRPIQITTCNNQLTPAGSAACARQAVSGKFHAVTGSDAVSFASLPILSAGKVPAVFWPIQPTDAQIPNNFQISGGGLAELFGVPWAAQKSGAKTAAIIYIQFPGFDTVVKNAENVAAKAGLKITKVVSVSPTQSTFSAPVQQVRGDNPDAVILLVAGPQAAGIVQAAVAQGFNPTWATDLGAFNPEQFKSLAKIAKKLYFVSSFPPATDSRRFPGIARYSREMNAAGKAGVKDAGASNRNESSINTWLAVHAIAKVAKGIKGNITAASLRTAIQKTRGVDVAGLISWSRTTKGANKYPGIKDQGRLFVGPVKNGVYTPALKPIKALAGVNLE